MSSVLDRLGSITPGKRVATTRALVVGAVVFALVLGGWLAYAFSHPESTTLFPVDLVGTSDEIMALR